MYYRNIFIAANISVALISSVYYIYKIYLKNEKKEKEEEISKSEIGENDPNIIGNNLQNVIEVKENGNKEIILSSIYSLLKEIKECPTEENLITLANCGAFTKLQNEIYKYSGLPILLELSSNEDINIRICALWNIEKIIKEFISLDGISRIKFHLGGSCNENEICHTLRIYQNISVINEISEKVLFITGERILKLITLNNPKFTKIIIKMLVNFSCNKNLHEILMENKVFDLLLRIDYDGDELITNILYIIKNLLLSLNEEYLKEFKESGLYVIMNKVKLENELRLCIMKIIKSINVYIYNEFLKILK